ncbi:glycosyltransferase family 2 protein [Acidovorax kalamii]|uniref:Glycosyl transferase n=1 Tax=Acidovorax kalamii TaxID=2004485 RepID=A0A235EMM7_9BURK|nr:glycosyltransferase family 2 protein [Acidovorax kalamii]OYD50288.1 glycosyl transferase [Acidovorax kalamii]
MLLQPWVHPNDNRQVLPIAPSHPPAVVVSIVSHAHGHQIQSLLEALVRLNSQVVSRVVLTLNVPEPAPLLGAAQSLPFALEIVQNELPLGFGANHNKALVGAEEEFVCVLNPDVTLNADPFAPLVHALAGQATACAYPVQVDENGSVQDSEREIPSPGTLLRRRLLGRIERRVDWVNAACLLLPTSVWRDLGGFDERYFMYCEDVDFCLRLRLKGGRLLRAPVKIVHAGQRASGRRLNHLAWHVRSLLRLWMSPVYRQAQQLLTATPPVKGTIGTP